MRSPSLMSLHGLRPVHWLLLLPFLLWLAPLGLIAAFTSGLNDDAFISFRYARNLLEGQGLVFNPGERVEGYTNFLWVLELAALWGAFGLRPEQAAPLLSAAFTAATLAAMLWWAARLPSLPHRGLVCWMALGLVCSSATFAQWTLGGGLEMRQFTFFVVLAVTFLSLGRGSRRALLAASLSLAAASLTRPEGALIAACCCGWFAVQRRVDAGRWFPDWCAAACLVAPWVTAVALHYMFRYGYYGEWLPNTYHAKFVRPWYEAGWRYLLMAALDTGLYLLAPLAVLSLAKGWRRAKDLTHALPLLCIFLHMAHVARMGGDLFGYRLLDFYWPLLAVPAAEGVVHLGVRASRALPRAFAAHSATVARTCAVGVFLPVLFYASAMQAVVLRESAATAGEGPRIPPVLDDDSAGWLLAAPGMPALAEAAQALRSTLWGKKVGWPWSVRRVKKRLFWNKYKDMERGVIPSDAMTVTRNVPLGTASYFLPNLKFIDYLGLADAVIARNPVPYPNSRRQMAHDRRPPPGYLAKRGVNFFVRPAAASLEQALESAVYAVQVGPDLWMPFNAPDLEWVAERFEAFSYDVDADRQFEQALNRARLLISARFEVWLDGSRLLYVKDRCNPGFEERFYLHVVPADPDDLPAQRKQFGFDNLDFFVSEVRLGTVRRCAAARTLPDFPVAAIRTGQFNNYEGRQFWEGEFFFSPPHRPAPKIHRPMAGPSFH